MPGEKRGPGIVATLDRIETGPGGEGLAVLVLDDEQQIVVPLSSIPAGSGQGDVLRLRFERDEAETRRRLDRVRSLQRELFRE